MDQVNRKSNHVIEITAEICYKRSGVALDSVRAGFALPLSGMNVLADLTNRQLMKANPGNRRLLNEHRRRAFILIGTGQANAGDHVVNSTGQVAEHATSGFGTGGFAENARFTGDDRIRSDQNARAISEVGRPLNFATCIVDGQPCR